MKTNFSELGLSSSLLKAVSNQGYVDATPIQAQAIPIVLSGRDLVGCAQTGTGKTAAFTLPMLDRLMQTRPKNEPPRPPANTRRGNHRGPAPRPRPIRALILAPTRELTAQIGDSLSRYGQHTPIRSAMIYGGVSQVPQVKALRHGVDVLVATPGRLLDLMNQGYINLSKVQILVLDEADQMLDMGFLPDLKRIVDKVPTERQTLMFSATMPPEIRQLATQWLNDPVSIEVVPAATPADRISQRVHLVDAKKKAELLLSFLKETPRSRTLVFSRTKHGADKIAQRLQKDGLKASAIHGNKSQGARMRALKEFKGKDPPILVATDIAARGLDIRDVSHIVNYDLPETPETYVHRIGRTARAGAEGTAISFCARHERKLLYAIERLMKCRIEVESSDEGPERSARNNKNKFSRGGKPKWQRSNGQRGRKSGQSRDRRVPR